MTIFALRQGREKAYVLTAGAEYSAKHLASLNAIEDRAAQLFGPERIQAIGYGRTSLALSLLRQIVCLLPLFWLLAKLGLGYTWLAFPLAELITGVVGLVLYLRVLRQWQARAN